jgi:hypothetical protein
MELSMYPSDLNEQVETVTPVDAISRLSDRELLEKICRDMDAVRELAQSLAPMAEKLSSSPMFKLFGK